MGDCIGCSAKTEILDEIYNENHELKIKLKAIEAYIDGRCIGFSDVEQFKKDAEKYCDDINV